MSSPGETKPTLLIATGNAGKLREFRSYLSAHFTCVAPVDSPYDKTPAPEVDENGDTYYENALKKAVAYFRAYRVPVLADDSGLEVDVLDGKPGVHSARFAGPHVAWPDRWRFLNESIGEREPRTARFRSILCYYDGARVPFFFEGSCEGLIHREPRGGKGFGYDPIFFSTALGKTFGEATDAEKSEASHRAVAVRCFLAWAESDAKRSLDRTASRGY